MSYVVNGTPMTREELIKKVLETVLDLGEEKSPMMTYRAIYPVEYNVKHHACKIARALGWEVEVVR
jgi:hypothetical protein